MRLSHSFFVCCGLLFASPAGAEEVIFHGKVTLEDGSPPGRLVTIQRVCRGLDHTIREGLASAKTGEYFVKLQLNNFGSVYSSLDSNSMLPCVLEATATGFVSTQLDLLDPKVTNNPRLPVMVLMPKSRTSIGNVDELENVPHAASRPWSEAVKYLNNRNWAGAEAPLRLVVKAAPKFAAGWVALGTVCSNIEKAADARQALEKAIELEPKQLPPYLALIRSQMDLKEWQAAADTSKTLLALDTKHVFLEAYLLNAASRYQLADFDGALAQIHEAIRLDKTHELTRSEYMLGLVLEAKKDFAGAEEHLHAYLTQHPHAKDEAAISDRISNLGKGAIADISKEVTALDLGAAAAGEAPVPGGIKAFSAVAQLPGTPTYENFFLEYARAIADAGPTGVNATREAGDAIRAFIAVVSALEIVGEHRANSTLVRISFGSDEQIRKTEAILATLGWKLSAKGNTFSVEPGDHTNDGFRQWALAGLGVDELALREAVDARKDFEFEIPRENARLAGGAAWGVVLKGVPELPGGPIEAFIKDWRFARVYTGLGAMEGDSAAAIVSAVGLANLITKYSTLMADYGSAVGLDGQHVATPGGATGQAAWTKVAGTSPQNTTAFLRALFEKDQGHLLTFYYDLAHADAAHQQYFTKTPERAEAFYKWYRDTTGANAIANAGTRWQARVLQSVRLDNSGKIVFPGGRAAWSNGSESDDEVLLHQPHLDALAAMAVLEQKRRAPLSSAAAQLLAQHYGEWRELFPYFEKLPGLDEVDFHALADFAADAMKAPRARQDVLAGEWHSLVTLLVLGSQSGSVNPAQGAQAFRQICDAMRSANPSSGAIEALRQMAGGAADVDDAVAARLLRLSGGRREAYESVKTLQNVPRIATLGESPDAAKTLAALSGMVYAALLDPAYLLVAEDSRLVSKHAFVPPSVDSPEALFARSSLTISNGPPGTNFSGGFGTFQEVARSLQSRTEGELQPESTAAASPTPEAAPAEGPISMESAPHAGSDLIFRAGGRIVEVYATVTDNRGRYLDDLSAGQFTVLEEGQSKPVFAFENHTSAVSVALLFDTTGSMVTALPTLKNAAMQLVDGMRPTDSVAVYSFSDTVTELQPFTSDKESAKRAILQTHAAGVTALYDAVLRVNHDLSARTGKKVIIVFTDGADNSSMLTADNAVERAKERGIPIYTIAEGEALTHPELIAQLANMSHSTGGTPFLIRKLSDIEGVFDKMSQDLMHGYLVAFQPSPGDNHVWRKIQVVLSGPKGLQVRARDGFYVE